MSFTESAAAARAFRDAQGPPPEANRELLALGAANAIAACFGAMAAGGGTSQTAVNRQAGARTQLAALVTVYDTTGILTAEWETAKAWDGMPDPPPGSRPKLMAKRRDS